MHAERCTCRECRLLDTLPDRLQGVPGTFQFALFGKERQPLITPEIFRQLADHLRADGYGDDIQWAESCCPPRSAMIFAREAIFVICNSGMKHTVAVGIFERVMAALRHGGSAHDAFGHKGKSNAIDMIWANRSELRRQYLKAADKLEFCRSLPWIGDITKYHLAKNFGAQVAKPDVHLQRLADHEGCTAQQLCERVSAATGYKVPTVDTVLWRACATGLINSKALT